MEENKVNIPTPPKELRNMPPPPPPKQAGTPKQQETAQTSQPNQNVQPAQNAQQAQATAKAAQSTQTAQAAQAAQTQTVQQEELVEKNGKKTKQKPGEIMAQDKAKADFRSILYWIGIFVSLAAIVVLIYFLVV